MQYSQNHYYHFECSVSGNTISFNVYDGTTLLITDSITTNITNIKNMANKEFGFLGGYYNGAKTFIKNIIVEAL